MKPSVFIQTVFTSVYEVFLGISVVALRVNDNLFLNDTFVVYANVLVKVLEVDLRESLTDSYISLELENPTIRTVHKLSCQPVKRHMIPIMDQTWNQ